MYTPMSGTRFRQGFGPFAAYTGLGYLALVLHHWVFAPQMAESVTGMRVVLVLVNLAAGSWCFIRALRMLLPVRQ